MDEENERFAARAGSMKESKSVAAKHPGFKEAFLKIQWLLLKSLWLSSFKITAQGKVFQGFTPATDEEMERFCQANGS